MRIDDFTLLGWTAPHTTKRNGDVICAAGYSREQNRFIRIYPLPFPFPLNIHRWDNIRAPLVRNSQDNRDESWKIDYGDRSREQLCSLVQPTGSTTRDWEKGWLFKHVSASIDALNEERRSLGLVKPVSIRPAFRPSKLSAEIVSDRLFEDNGFKLCQNPVVPTIEIVNSDGTANVLQLLEWGCSEYLRKNPFNHEGLWKALHLDNPAYEHLLLVGNNNQHRTTWLAIALLSYKIEHTQQVEMFAQQSA